MNNIVTYNKMIILLTTLLILSSVGNIYLTYHLFSLQSAKSTKQEVTTSSLSKDRTIRDTLSHQHHSPVLPIKKLQNPLVIIIGCIKYHIKDKADLPGTKMEVKKMLRLFKDVFKYDKVVCTYVEGRPKTEELRKKQIHQLLDEQVEYLKKHKHDGVIVIYSGHGNLDTILDSFGKSLSVTRIKDKFRADNLPQMAGKPKLFLFSKCRGGDTVLPLQVNNHIYHPEQDFISFYSNIEGCQIDDHADKNGAFMIDELSQISLKTFSQQPIVDIFRHISHNLQTRSTHKELVVQHIQTSYQVYLEPNNKPIPTS